MSISYTCEHTQVVTDLQASCNKSVHQADIRMRSQLLVPSCLTNLEQVASILVDNFVGLVTSCLNKSDIALLAT